MGQRPDAGAHVREGAKSRSSSATASSRLCPICATNRCATCSSTSRACICSWQGHVRQERHRSGRRTSSPGSAAADERARGNVVNLDVSKGGRRTCSVPNFVGMTIDEARDAAAEAGIKLGQIVWTPFGPDGPARGIVVRQSPAAAQDRPVRAGVAASQRRAERVGLPRAPGPRAVSVPVPRDAQPASSSTCGSRSPTRPAPGTSTTASRNPARSSTSTSPRSARRTGHVRQQRTARRDHARASSRRASTTEGSRALAVARRVTCMRAA